MRKIIVSDKFLDTVGILMPIAGITLWPFIIIREHLKDDETLINHESIHIRQQAELLVIGFYLLYGWYYLKNRWGEYSTHDEAYRNIPFEIEAYTHQEDQQYLNGRPFQRWTHYIGKKHD